MKLLQEVLPCNCTIAGQGVRESHLGQACCLCTVHWCADGEDTIVQARRGWRGLQQCHGVLLHPGAHSAGLCRDQAFDVADRLAALVRPPGPGDSHPGQPSHLQPCHRLAPSHMLRKVL